LAELRGRSHNFIELLHYFALLVHEQLRVSHHVDKKDVRSFEVTRFFSCSSHSRDQLTHEPQAPLHHSFGASEATIFSNHGSPGSGSVELFRCELPQRGTVDLFHEFEGLSSIAGDERRWVKKPKKVLAYVQW
jgi:hypothetical protein